MIYYPDLEPIYVSLWHQFAGIIGDGKAFKKASSRKLRHWTEVKPEEQPCIFQVQPDPQTVRIEWLPNGAPIIRCFAALVIYDRSPKLLEIPSTSLNNLVSATLACLEPPVASSTLRLELFDVASGAKVASHARVNGTIEMIEGVAGTDVPQSVVTIPVEILVTN